jgi:gliding motility-associated lipoprotein GldD
MNCRHKISAVRRKTFNISCLVIFLLLSGCHGDYTPKPKAYPLVVFPNHEYEMYDPQDCPFKFEKPKYSEVIHDTTYFGKRAPEPCWLTVNIGPFNGTINLTYKEISPKQSLAQLLEDAHKLSYKHTEKADYINEIGIENKHGVSGLLYDVGGDAASNVQFFLTDSSKHFIRGALYFNNEPNTDSMAPIITFVKADLKHMLQTFEWK